MNEENLMQLIYDDMQEMKRQQIITNKHLDGIDKRFDNFEARVLDNTEEIKRINLCLEHNTEEIKRINLCLEHNAEEIERINLCLEHNTEQIKAINLCLENEIRPSIMRIAEGHLDLSRKLDEALKIDQEKEKITLRLNFLEGKVERLESKVAGLA